MVPEMSEMNKNELFRKNCPIEPNEFGIALYWSLECPCKVWFISDHQNGQQGMHPIPSKKCPMNRWILDAFGDSDLTALISFNFIENCCNR